MTGLWSSSPRPRLLPLPYLDMVSFCRTSALMTMTFIHSSVRIEHAGPFNKYLESGNQTNNLTVRHHGEALHHCAACCYHPSTCIKVFKTKLLRYCWWRLMVHRGVDRLFADSLLSVLKFLIYPSRGFRTSSRLLGQPGYGAMETFLLVC